LLILPTQISTGSIASMLSKMILFPNATCPQ
jgi:hypothetical protein